MSEEELKEFLASHYTPSMLVLAGVNMRHEQLVQLILWHHRCLGMEATEGGRFHGPVHFW